MSDLVSEAADLELSIDKAVKMRMPWAVDALQRLVRSQSITGNEAAAQAVVAELMSELGLEVDIWEPDPAALLPFEEHIGRFDSLAGRPNVVGIWPGTGSGKSLILNGHIDTVDAGIEAGWTWPPFDGVVSGGAVHGRGSLDMKGGIVTFLTAVGALQDLRFQPEGQVILESVISEEDGGAGTVATLLRGYAADAAVITEPTECAIYVTTGGSVMFRLTIRGKTAHAAARDEGVSSIEKFWPFWQGLQEFERERNALIDHPLYADIPNKIPINIGKIEAGTWASTVPEVLTAECRVGLAPGEDLLLFKEEVVTLIHTIAAEDPWLREHPPEIEWFSGQFAPSEIAVDHPLVVAMAECVHDTTGRAPKIAAATYGADMRHFLNESGIPCIMFGAGDVKLAHHVDERMALDELELATAVLARFIPRWTTS